MFHRNKPPTTPHFVSLERAAHIRAFEELQQSAHDVLSEPTVQRQLGDVSLRLLDICDNAFLPNVNSGLVVIPSDMIDTDRIGILPTGAGAGYASFWAGPSVLQPTRTGRQRVIEQFEQAGRTAHDAEQFMSQAIGRCLDPLPLSTPRDLYAHTSVREENDPETFALFTTRPLIVGAPNLHEMLSVETGLVISHELSHVDDHESAVDSEVDILDWYARTETRAYHREVLAMAGLAAMGWDVSQFETAERANEIEALRQQHETSFDPYYVTFELMDELRNRGVFAPDVLEWMDRIEAA